MAHGSNMQLYFSIDCQAHQQTLRLLCWQLSKMCLHALDIVNLGMFLLPCPAEGQQLQPADVSRLCIWHVSCDPGMCACSRHALEQEHHIWCRVGQQIRQGRSWFQKALGAVGQLRRGCGAGGALFGKGLLKAVTCGSSTSRD